MPVTKNRRDGYLLVKDGNAAEDEVTFMNSDITFHDPVELEPIPIKDRKGNLDHVKRNDPFGGWGMVSFSFKYVDRDLREKLSEPEESTVVTDDKVPDGYPCVNLEFVLLDESGDPEEIIYMYNVWFNPGNLVFNDGDESSNMSAQGTIFGKYDASATNNRRFTKSEEAPS